MCQENGPTTSNCHAGKRMNAAAPRIATVPKRILARKARDAEAAKGRWMEFVSRRPGEWPGKLMGLPYLPVTPYLAPLPLPVSFQLLYGKPMRLQGSPSDSDEIIAGHVEVVKERIARLIAQGRALREGRLDATEIDFG